MTNKELANFMYPKINMTIDELEKKYPKRNLKDGEVVSRYAPSPTGFVHMGNMLSCFIESFLPKQKGGIFYLRIEDTDQKRKIDGGIENIIDAIKAIGIEYDEGVISKDIQKGSYGPYIQSQRKEIYDTFAKHMIENDMAYPCFCTKCDLSELREKQEKRKDRIGYYGQYAKCRHLSNEKRVELLKQGVPYTIRLKSMGNFDKKFVFNDLVKGRMLLPENDQDVILVKSDGIPVYHFAHLVDDHLMHTTHVLRGEDWLPSVPVHVELFDRFGFELPKYAHLGLIMIVDENGSKRKISKRKDKNFTVQNYRMLGFPSEALQEYLMTIANTNFEEWRKVNSNVPLNQFPFSFSKVGSSPLFDYSKLINISKNYISKIDARTLYTQLIEWCEMYDLELYNILKKDEEYAISILNIEREQKKPRKDYAMYSDIRKYSWYMFDELFYKNKVTYDWQNINNLDEIRKILSIYFKNYYNESDDKETWFNKIKNLCDEFGYASNMKEYKINPEKFKGNVADISTVIRVAVTTSSQTPDLYEILKKLGLDRINKRIEMI